MKISHLLFVLFLTFISPNFTFAQEEKEETPRVTVIGNDSIYHTVEEMPAFPGGETKLFNYLSENIIYPKLAKEKNTTGKVYATFIVETDGSVYDVSILRGIGDGCDEEVIRIINAMPKWTPGFQDGKAVKVKYILPVAFNLKDAGK